MKCNFKRHALCAFPAAFIAFAIEILLIVTTATAAADTGESGADIVGFVPRLLTAVSDRNAQCTECKLGDAVADAIRIYLNSDVTIICGGDLVRNLPPGEVTIDELKDLFLEDRILATTRITPRELRDIMEAGLGHIVLNKMEKIDEKISEYEGFPQISGFTVLYDASQAPGERIRDIMIDGISIDLQDDTSFVTLASTLFMLNGGYGLPKMGTEAVSNMTMSDAMARYVNDGMSEYLTTGHRIIPAGNQSGTLVSTVPTGFISAVAAVYLLANSWRYKRKYNFER